MQPIIPAIINHLALILLINRIDIVVIKYTIIAPVSGSRNVKIVGIKNIIPINKSSLNS